MKKNSLLGLILCIHLIGLGQVSSYDYKRHLNGITDEWHSIELPDAVFNKINSSFNDIRVYGFTKKDTVEAPYFISTQKEEIFKTKVEFNVLNKVQTAKGYFYTLKMNKKDAINAIDLDFELDNYDWEIRVEGSHDERNWFTVVKDYRILSINTEFTNYSFNRVEFSNASYTYFRVFVPSLVDPGFISPKIILTKRIEGKTKKYTVISKNQYEAKKKKETIVKIRLKEAVPISQIQIQSEDGFDYYRPIRIEYLYDSTKTTKGYMYHYETLAYGTFSSFEENNFRVNNVIAKNLRITIQNYDNKPIRISNIEVKGNVYELHARFTDDANYFMVYGNPNCPPPIYDIDHFRSTVPAALKSITIGEEIVIKKTVVKDEVPKEQPPFLESKAWIWAIMGIVIVILGWFTFKMLRAEDSNN